MVEDNDLITEHELDILHLQIIYLMSRKLLIILEKVVSEEPNRPTCKWRHIWQLRAAVAAKNSF
ncbi:hypothetical protein D3C87_1706490 [compost metagenome]